jgi:hypothetical protein
LFANSRFSRYIGNSIERGLRWKSMKATITVSQHDLMEAILEENPKMKPDAVRKFIHNNLNINYGDMIDLELTFHKPKAK